jgi:hypothetical protein
MLTVLYGLIEQRRITANGVKGNRVPEVWGLSFAQKCDFKFNKDQVFSGNVFLPSL